MNPSGTTSTGYIAPPALTSADKSTDNQLEPDALDKLSLIQKLISEKKTAQAFQKRKHDDWNENYELYRGRTRTNRLTQRQAVTIPLMKETIKTALSKIDNPPATE